MSLRPGLYASSICFLAMVPRVVMSESGSIGGSHEAVGLRGSLRSILTGRNILEVDTLASKLSAHGITDINSFQVLSKATVVEKLFPDLLLGELADVLQVWTCSQKRCKGVGTCSSNGYTLTVSCKGKSENSTREISRSAKAHFPDVEGGRSRSARSSRTTRARSRSARGYRQEGGREAIVKMEVKREVENCAGVNSSVDHQNLSLWTAIIENNVDDVRRLVFDGVNIESRHHNWTPLMAVCERGHFCMATFLLEHRADTSAVSRRGRCALSFAAAPSKDDCRQEQRVSQLDIIRLLAKHGASIDRRDRWGRSPRDHAEASSKALVTSDPRLKRAQAAKLLGELDGGV